VRRPNRRQFHRRALAAPAADPQRPATSTVVTDGLLAVQRHNAIYPIVMQKLGPAQASNFSRQRALAYFRRQEPPLWLLRSRPAAPAQHELAL
jgi:hypothetical protein